MRKIGEFRIKSDPEETGVINRRDKRTPNSKLGVGENGIIFIEMNANSFVLRKPEAVDDRPVAQNFEVVLDIVFQSLEAGI